MRIEKQRITGRRASGGRQRREPFDLNGLASLWVVLGCEFAPLTRGRLWVLPELLTGTPVEESRPWHGYGSCRGRLRTASIRRKANGNGFEREIRCGAPEPELTGTLHWPRPGVRAGTLRRIPSAPQEDPPARCLGREGPCSPSRPANQEQLLRRHSRRFPAALFALLSRESREVLVGKADTLPYTFEDLR